MGGTEVPPILTWKCGCVRIKNITQIREGEIKMAKTAWIFSYKLRKNVSEEEFIKRTQRLHDEIISKAKGFISWEHYLQDSTWTDFVLWETEEDARNATVIGQGHAVTQEFYDCIRMQTCRALISTLVRKY